MKTYMNKAMKKTLFVFLTLMLTTAVGAQSVPNVIPPSPEASSIVGYGNTNVNFYSGSPSFSVPIYSVGSRGFSIPVSLNYSGFGGIKVEDIAPWVGLGWSLNAGGVVSRTIKGLADDQATGYKNQPAISNLTTSTTGEYQDYADGVKDGEPDEFNFNVNGLSGSFFINKGGQVVQKTKSNIKITPVYAGFTLSSFEIRNIDGTKYVFTEQEKTKSFPIDGNPLVYTYDVTSWYLTSVEDVNGNNVLTLEYHTLTDIKHASYYAQNELETSAVFGLQYMNMSWNYTLAKRIKKITFDHGYMEFNASSTTRQDYLSDKWLDNITIKDENGMLIKKFTMHYSYFSETGTAAINSTPRTVYFDGKPVGDHERRLRLDEVKEWDNTGTVSNPPYIFEYNTDYIMPGRYSFAQDHWGYFNGQTGNTSPEPQNRVTYYNVSYNVFHQVFGSANKSPNEVYNKVCVLKKVTYPTGGYTEFEFGQHLAVEAKLRQNTFSNQVNNFEPDGTFHTFSISLEAEPFAIVQAGVDVQGTCDVSVSVYNSAGTTYITGQTLSYTGGLYSHGTATFNLPEGTYKIRANKIGCSWNSLDNVRLNWDNEVTLTNKPVGGLRVEAIVDHDGINEANNVRREFYYNENGDNGTSASTGRLVSVPRYGVQRIINTNYSGSGYNMIPEGYTRTIRTSHPLMTTNGAEVGYGKVTVRTIGVANNGKTEYYFTTAADYQDLYDGYFINPLSGETYFYLGSAGSHETYPYPRSDSRDLLRGLLTKQIDYRWTGSTYHKVKEVINTYAGLFNMPVDNGTTANVSWLANTVATNGSSYESVEGIVHKPGVHNSYKRYRIYSGIVSLQKSVVRNYDLGSNTNYAETETTNFWDDLSSGYFNISRVQTKDSENVTYETKMFYPYDVASLSGLTTNEINALNGMVSNKNLISPVVQQEQYKSTTKLSTTRTNYGTYTGKYLPESIEAAKGTASLEARVTLHEYDSYGNLLGASKDGGAQQRYIYGYDSQLPTAQVIGSTSNTEIAYTSFEQDQKGNWTYSGVTLSDANAPTGKKYYNLSNGSISKSGLTTSTKYKVTYYAKNAVPSVNGVQSSNDAPSANANGWKYYEKIVTGITSLTISGSAYVDEVRLYPVDAQMITYTYDLLYGVTSQTGMNHNIVKYVYDAFGRLQLVKDLDGKVIQANDIQYQVTTSY